MRAAVVFHSVCGNDYLLAKMFEKAFASAGADVRLRRVKDDDLQNWREVFPSAAHYADEILSAPVASIEDLANADIGGRACGKNCVGRKYVRRRKISAGAGARCGAEKRQKAVVIGRARLQAFEARFVPLDFQFPLCLVFISVPHLFSISMRVLRYLLRAFFNTRPLAVIRFD